MPDVSQIPPQVLQALQQKQQQGASSVDVGDMLQQLMKMSPDEVASTLQQMGVQVSPAQIQSAAENWVDGAAEDASGADTTQADAGDEEDASTSSTPDAAPSSASVPAVADDEEAEAVPDDEAAEGEAPMPSRGGGGGNMDELVSAMMAQQASGDANAPVPSARGPQTPLARPSAPNVPMGRAGPSTDPRMAALIAQAYRSAPRGRTNPPPPSRGRGRG